MPTDHQKQHRENGRFNGRHAITHIGLSCGRECAIETAKGLIDGGIDELVTMLGDHAAYEAVMAAADRIIKPAGEPVRPKK